MRTSSLGFLTLLFVGVTLSACSPKFHETITDQRSGTVIGGYCEGCELSFQQTFKPGDSLSYKLYNTWKKKGIDPLIRNQAKLQAITVEDTSYATSRGVKIGDELTKVRLIYGRPWKKQHIYIDLGDKNTYYFGSAYIYKGVTFFYDQHKEPKQVVSFNIYRNDYQPIQPK